MFRLVFMSFPTARVEIIPESVACLPANPVPLTGLSCLASVRKDVPSTVVMWNAWGGLGMYGEGVGVGDGIDSLWEGEEGGKGGGAVWGTIGWRGVLIWGCKVNKLILKINAIFLPGFLQLFCWLWRISLH